MESFTSKLLTEIEVSRETIERLKDLVSLLTKWNTAINLVSKATIENAWTRHIVDSAQIFSQGSTATRWADLGSGGGFPGLVVAAIAAEKAPGMQVTLVESDQRKAAFLRHASLSLGLQTFVIADRAEAIRPLVADVVSARALASLPQLCSLAQRHLSKGGKAIFLKGKSCAAEIDAARKEWCFMIQTHVSITDPTAAVLVLKDLVHV